MAGNGTLRYSDVAGGPVEKSSIEAGVYGTLLDFELSKTSEVTPEDLARQEAYGQYVPYMSAPKSKVYGDLAENVICFDTETTGLNPWEYQLLVCSFWPLNQPKNEMVTFADWDEESLTREIAEYLNSFDEFALTGYNVAFDVRALVTRFMFFQIPVPAMYTCMYFDTREHMRKGVWSNINSDQPTGSLENWITFFYDEAKPYTIEECMAAVLDNDLTPFIVRNRWDVATEGDLYFLTRYIQTGEMLSIGRIKPTSAQVTEEKVVGNVLTQCPVCLAYNQYDLAQESQPCYVCGADIKRPEGANILIEKVRELKMPASSKKMAE